MKDVIIGGGGFSVKEGIEKGLFEKIKDKEVWSLNFFYKFMPYPPKRQLWTDTSFYRTNVVDIEKLLNQGVELHCRENPYYNLMTYVKQYPIFREKSKESENQGAIFTGHMGLSGLFSLSIAIKENYDRIFLLGYDYGTPSLETNNTHFYIDKVKEMNIQSSGVGKPVVYREPTNGKVKSNVSDFEYYRPYKDKIFNVSLISNISEFKMISYDEFFEML